MHCTHSSAEILRFLQLKFLWTKTDYLDVFKSCVIKERKKNEKKNVMLRKFACVARYKREEKKNEENEDGNKEISIKQNNLT